MPYNVIKDFKRGLDTRRSELSSVPGTLLALNNMHINEGGEGEKRKAFVRYALPVDTFGLLATEDTIYTFGSKTFRTTWAGSKTDILTDDGGVTFYARINITDAQGEPPEVGFSVVVTGSSIAEVNGTHTIFRVDVFSGIHSICFYVPLTGPLVTEVTSIAWSWPANITYQQLTHPVSGVSMTGVRTATNFSGKVFVVTEWSNGDVLEFYDSVLVEDFISGQKSNIYPTAWDVAQDLVNQAVATGKYTGSVGALPSYLYFQVTGGTAVPFTNFVYEVFYDFGRAVSISNGAGYDTATQFNILGDNSTVVSVDWTTSNAATAAAIVAAINSNNPYGFVASVGTPTNTVKITPPAVDYFGNPLGLSKTDNLLVYTYGDVIIYTAPNIPTFSILSIPDENSSNPFSVEVTTTEATLTYQFISAGTSATAAASAVGQISIIAGSNNTQATGTITAVSIPAANATVTIGGTTYTFVPSFVTSLANQVLIGTSATDSLQNLIYAINATSTQYGIKYSINTVTNTQVSAAALAGATSVVTSFAGGSIGNTIATTSSSGAFTWGAATLTGGDATDKNQITSVTVSGVALTSGEVPFNQSVELTVSDLVTAINNYTGTSGFSASSVGNTVTILAPAGTSYNSATVIVTAAGNVCMGTCTFVVGSVVAGNTVTSIVIVGGTYASTNLLTATITYRDGGHLAETVQQFLARIATNINANSGTSGWLCYSDATNLKLSYAVSSNLDVVPTSITQNGTAPFSNGGGGALLTVTLSQVGLTMIKVLTLTSHGVNYYQYTTANAPSSIFATVTNSTITPATPPYNYVWTVVSSTNNTPVLLPKITGNSSSQWWQTGNREFTISGSQIWRCTITDSAVSPLTGSADFTLYF